MERKCVNCALKNLQNGMCPIFHANMEDENGCPNYTSTIEYCEICGNIVLRGGTFEYDFNTNIHFECDPVSWTDGNYIKNFIKRNKEEPVVQYIFG